MLHKENYCKSDSGVVVSDIEWDTDFHSGNGPHSLPQNITMDLLWCYTVEEIEDLISYTLNHEYQFRHKGFSWRFATENDR
jgi:hypothetical protein